MQIAIVSHLCEWFDTRSLPINPYLPFTSSSEPHTPKKGVYRTPTAASQSAVPTCIIATSNRPEDIDLTLRRSGRLEQEIEVICARQDRVGLLYTMLIQALVPLRSLFDHNSDHDMALEDHVRTITEGIIDRLGGYVAADIQALVRETCILLSKRIRATTSLLSDVTLSELPVPSTLNDASTAADAPLVSSSSHMIALLRASLEESLRSVSPSALRGVSIKVPNVSAQSIYLSIHMYSLIYIFMCVCIFI